MMYKDNYINLGILKLRLYEKAIQWNYKNENIIDDIIYLLLKEKTRIENKHNDMFQLFENYIPISK